jgi:hypothetical protein
MNGVALHQFLAGDQFEVAEFEMSLVAVFETDDEAFRDRTTDL